MKQSESALGQDTTVTLSKSVGQEEQMSWWDDLQLGDLDGFFRATIFTLTLYLCVNEIFSLLANIYVFNKNCAVLMDCAEGAYG